MKFNKIFAFFFIGLQGCLGFVFAQTENSLGSNTYAVVIGISKYQHPEIPPLQFADRDARAFVDFLQSKAGGNTPDAHIKLLINEKASFANIYNALFSLLDSAGKNDLIYFYFSGHGDVENKLFANLGYLLAYNTPSNNYINHAIRIEDINQVANTLSLNKGAKVVLVTDACRSGKLAGDAIGGKQLVGAELRQTKQNEVRLAACGPNQLSAENAAWGGGRGVFSYYLEQGLYGLANTENNAFVSSGEIKQYLIKSLAQDKVLKRENFVQEPVVIGSNSINLSTIDQSKLSEIRRERNKLVILPGNLAEFGPVLGKVMPKPMDVFFEALTKIRPENIRGLDNLDAVPKTEMLEKFLELIRPLINEFELAQINTLLLDLKTDPNLRKQFLERVVAYIADQGQELITAYLNGDQAELDKRSYYNVSQKFYDNYLKLYEKALNVLPENHYLYHPLEVNLNYFSGVVARLKFPTVPDASALFDTAFQFQQRAFKLEPYAAYINNELGVLYAYKGNQDSAYYYYNRATELSPAWAIPWANLVGLYNRKGDLAKARDAAAIARSIKPDLQVLYSNEGITEELSKNYLRAEELQLKNIKLNDRHYFPYERLGHIYAATIRYEAAEKNFYESAIRKKGFFLSIDTDADGVPDIKDQFPPPGMVNTPFCPFPEPDSLETDSYWLLMQVFYNRNNQNDETTEYQLRKILVQCDTNFLLNHYYGIFLYDQKRYAEAEPYLSKSISQSISLDSLVQMLKQNKLEERMGLEEGCLKFFLSQFKYNLVRDEFVLADIYQNLGYLTQATDLYDKIIRNYPTDYFVPATFLKADLLFEKERYHEAEQVWLNYKEQIGRIIKEVEIKNPDLFALLSINSGEFELENFYSEILLQVPQSTQWNQKAAEYWFNKIYSDPEAYIISGSMAKVREDNAENNFDDTKEQLYIDKAFAFNKTLEINYQVNFRQPLSFPYMRTLKVLQNAITLSVEEDDLIRFNIMRGKLLRIEGKKEDAAMHYVNALDIAPNDATIRSDLADIYKEAQMLTAAFGQLDTLNLYDQLLVERYAGLTEMAIYKGDSLYALQLLNTCRNVLFQKSDSVHLLFGQFYAIHNDLSKAIPYLVDSIQHSMSLPDRMYTIALMYARLNNQNQAKEWLHAALIEGFQYGLVIENDPVWNILRRENQWAELMSNGRFIQYPDLK